MYLKIKAIKYNGTEKMRDKIFHIVGAGYGGGWDYDHKRFDPRLGIMTLEGIKDLTKGNWFIEIAEKMYLVLNDDQYNKLKIKDKL